MNYNKGLNLNNIHRNNFYIITGGPGSGKSTLLDALKSRGFQCVDEVAREIIQEQKRIDGDAIHTRNQIKFRDLMLARSIATYHAVNEELETVFFDRGIPDLLGYCYLINSDIPDILRRNIAMYRYSKIVFIAPPWEEIYQHDEERKQDWNEAVATYQNIKNGYTDAGYNLVELPKAPVDERVQFILNYTTAKTVF